MLLLAVLALGQTVALPVGARAATPASGVVPSTNYVAFLANPQERRGKFRHRVAFATLFAKVHEGMTKAQAMRLTGEPDVVERTSEAGAGQSGAATEIWLYGTTGTRNFPSLGSVSFSEDGTVVECRGNRDLPLPGLPPEPVLRQVFQAIDDGAEAEPAQPNRFDPLLTVRAVNAVLSLPPECRAAVVREYFRVGGLGSIAFVRALFDVPANPGYMPVPEIGDIAPPPPRDLSVCPRFPFAIVDDVPLDVTTGVCLTGLPELPSMHFDVLLRTCRMREEPLRPTDRPWEVLDDFQASPAWLFGATYEIGTPLFKDPLRLESAPSADTGTGLIQRQLVRLVRTVYPSETVDLSDRCTSPPLADWETVVAGLKNLGFGWDDKRQTYALADGTVLFPLKPPAERRLSRHVFAPPILRPVRGLVVVARKDAQSVSVYFRLSGAKAAGPGGVSLQLLADQNPAPVGTLSTQWDVDDELQREAGTFLSVPQGTAVRLQLTFNGRTFVGPPLTP